ncbi:hypothetical protein [Ornithinicoccus hortensis]|uniref:Uncharacterized protein n=1 Tax=Ornithinicoccus hortensis TaxID=82346 RepID=A0A542YNW3_9MICO|nr:hypothetical protein [Ornithinicoccus hortensis]TQL49805.1 hypothetical protein FB467_0898 [Ornithinicoccus hortensis]
MRTTEAPRAPDPELEQWLRSALSTAGEGFDAPGLISTTHRKVARQRRRHAVATVAVTGMAAVALVATWQAVDPLAGTSDLLDTASQPDSVAQESVGQAGDPLLQRDGEPTAQEGAVPWQEASPPLTQEEQDLGTTEGETEPSHGDWQIPDPRPTGVAFLDDLGDPQQHLTGDNMPPVAGMVGNDAAHDTGATPVAGQNWFYYADGQDLASLTAEITVTGWQDAPAAMEGLRADNLHFAWDVDQLPGTWQGHEDDPDRFVFETFERTEDDGAGGLTPLGVYQTSAVVRVGDYLVAATVTADSPQEAEEAAREISEKAAENLAVLDPEHGTD